MNAPFRGLLLWLPLASLLAQAPPRDLDPILVGRSNPFPPRGEIVDVAVQDGIAYCAIEGYGLAIYDARDPAHPMFLGAHETSSEGAWGRARAVAAFGTYACVAGESLSILDVSNPEEPWLVSRVNHTWDGGLGNVVVAGRYAYVTFDGGLQVIDLMVHPAGGTRFSLTGPPDWPLRVQRSADLKTWQDWQTVLLRDAPIQLAHPEPASQPRRFYRAVAP